MDTTRLAAKIAAFAFSVTVAAGALLLLSTSVLYVSEQWTHQINRARDVTMYREISRARQMSTTLGGHTNFIEYEKAHKQ